MRRHAQDPPPPPPPSPHELAMQHLRRLAAGSCGVAGRSEDLLVRIGRVEHQGPAAELLEALAALPDGAGPEAVAGAIGQWKR